MLNDQAPVLKNNETTVSQQNKAAGDYEIITDYTQWQGYESDKYLPTFRASADGGTTVPNTGLSFGWDHLRPFGKVSLDSTVFTVEGEVSGIKMSWVSWSDWTEKLPCFVNENSSSLGGIAFPPDGNTIIFGRGKRWDIASKG